MEKRSVGLRLSRHIWLLAACAALTLGSDFTPRSAAADSYLARFAGNWVGQGALRPAAEAAQETVYCRITAELSPDGTRLQQSGRCAVGEQSLPVAGVLVLDPQRGAVSGSWRGREGPVNITGHRRDHRLVMQLKYRFEGRDVSTTMTLEPVSDSRYRMLLVGSEGKGEVEFRRQ